MAGPKNAKLQHTSEAEIADPRRRPSDFLSRFIDLVQGGRIVSHNASDKVILPRLFQIWRHFQVTPV